MINRLMSLVLVLLANIAIVYSQEAAPSARFSHRGIKFSLASGNFEMTSERQLNEGEGGMLSLGYGFTDRFTLWGTLVGSEHESNSLNSVVTNFGGVEINLQHKFNPNSRWQPYGKVGAGLYGLEEDNSNITLIGGGINLAIGLDFFFAKHFGVGAELMVKKLDYFSEHVETETGEVITEIYPDLNGDTAGFMLTFTIQ